MNCTTSRLTCWYKKSRSRFQEIRLQWNNGGMEFKSSKAYRKYYYLPLPNNFQLLIFFQFQVKCPLVIPMSNIFLFLSGIDRSCRRIASIPHSVYSIWGLKLTESNKFISDVALHCCFSSSKTVLPVASPLYWKRERNPSGRQWKTAPPCPALRCPIANDSGKEMS